MIAAAQTFEFLERVNASTNPDQIAQMLFLQAAQLGFSGLAMGWLPPPSSQDLARFLVQALPQEYFRRYAQNRYDRQSAVVRHMSTTDGPFRWDEVNLDDEKRPLARRIMQEAWDFGLVSGWTMPIYRRGTLLGFVTASAQRAIEASPDLAQLHLMTLSAHSRILEITSEVGKRYLSDRELEVISWLARGKTADTIADIMGISSRTVHAHVANAGHRLGTANSTHTVVESIRLKLISI